MSNSWLRKGNQKRKDKPGLERTVIFSSSSQCSLSIWIGESLTAACCICSNTPWLNLFSVDQSAKWTSVFLEIMPVYKENLQTWLAAGACRNYFLTLNCAEGRTHLASIMSSCSQDGAILTASSSAIKFIIRSVDYPESPGHWRRFYCWAFKMYFLAPVDQSSLITFKKSRNLNSQYLQNSISHHCDRCIKLQLGRMTQHLPPVYLHFTGKTEYTPSG